MLQLYISNSKQLLRLKDFQGLTVNSDRDKFINLTLDQDKQKNEIQEILVTDFRSVKEPELSNVLLLLNENEYHCKHFLPEAITRGMSRLSILLLPSYKEFNKSGTALTIADEWEQINRSKNPILNTMILEFCSDPYCEIGEIYCENERSVWTNRTNFMKSWTRKLRMGFFQIGNHVIGKKKKDANN